MAAMKINAAARLKAVQVIPNVYPEYQGQSDIAAIQSEFARSRRRIGNDNRGFAFWWVGRGENTLVCVDRRTRKVAGFIDLRNGFEDVEVDGKDIKCRAINAMYLDHGYRGKGLILGMHQYLITQFNLISDDMYSPEGLQVWKQLQKIGHHIEVVDDRMKNKNPQTSWTDRYTRLLIRKGR